MDNAFRIRHFSTGSLDRFAANLKLNCHWVPPPILDHTQSMAGLLMLLFLMVMMMLMLMTVTLKSIPPRVVAVYSTSLNTRMAFRILIRDRGLTRVHPEQESPKNPPDRAQQ